MIFMLIGHNSGFKHSGIFFKKKSVGRIKNFSSRNFCRFFACFDLFGRVALWAIGGVSEWPMEHAWKACKRENVSWVRIPPPPYSYF